MKKVKAILSIILLVTTVALIVLYVQYVRTPSTAISLTDEEQQYLRARTPIKIAVDPDWEPFEKLNANGDYTGIAADYLKLIEKRLQITFDVVPTADWNESLAYSQAGRVTILPFLNKTEAREKWLEFTEPLIVDDNSIIGRYDSPYISNLHDVQHKTVALPEGTSVEERLRRDYPDLTIVLTKTEREAFALVSQGKVDFTIRSMLIGAYNIRKQGWFDLKVIGNIPGYTNYLAMGVTKGESQLTVILNKAILSLTEQERVDILNKHVPLRVETDDPNQAWRVFFIGATIAAAVLLIFSFIQSARTKRLAARNKEIQEIKERYEALSQLAGTYFWQMTMDGTYTYVSGEVEQVLGFPIHELIGASCTLHVRGEDVKVCRALMADGQVLKNYELPHLRKDGSRIWVKVFAMPLKDEQGHIIAYRGSSTDIEERKRLELQLVEAKNEMELAYYRAQIGPHFLYNALSAIAMYCLTQPAKASGLIVDLSFFLRRCFDFKRIENWVTLEQELELIEAYVNIEKVRYEQRLSVRYELDADVRQQVLPPLTLQPLVENAIQHGLMKRMEGGTIVIRVVEQERQVLFEVQDDGVGISPEQIAALQAAQVYLRQSEAAAQDGLERRGVGLVNIHARLMSMYGSELTLSLNETGGTTVSFRLPIMKKGEQA